MIQIYAAFGAALAVVATGSAGLIAHYRGQAQLSDCQRDSATEAALYADERAQHLREIEALKTKLAEQNAKVDAMAAAADAAGTAAANRALRVLTARRPQLQGAGTEVMNQWSTD